MSTPVVHHLVPAAETGLSPRQRLFCARIAGGASGAEAARLAGYARATAAQQASRMLQRPAIRAEVERLLADQGEAQQSALDRMLTKVERVYVQAMRLGHSSAALRAVEVEAVLRRHGARALPADVSPSDLEDERDPAKPAEIEG